MYLWHLVDGLRIGTERLLTLTPILPAAFLAGMRTPSPGPGATSSSGLLSG